MTPEKMLAEVRALLDAVYWKGDDMERAVHVLKEVPALLARVRELEDGLRETLAMAASPYIQTPPPSRFTNDTLAPTDRFTALRALLAKERGE